MINVPRSVLETNLTGGFGLFFGSEIFNYLFLPILEKILLLFGSENFLFIFWVYNCDEFIFWVSD